MVVKNVKLSWAFISRVDDNGNFRVSFEVTPEQSAEIDAELAKICAENNKDFSKADWQGSKKVSEDGTIIYSAKCAKVFKNKQGEEIQRELPVYDKKAVKMEVVPNIENGAIANVEVAPYFVKYKQKSGAMLSLKALQLISYTEYAGGNKFEAIEDDEAPFDTSEDSNLFK